MIGGSEERKNEVMAGMHSTKNDGHTCTLDESNSFMMTNQPKNAYLTPKRRENLIEELKKSKNIWDGLIGGQMKKGDKHTRWHAPQLSTSPSLLSDHVEACMKDYIAIVQERYPDLKYVRYNILKTAPNAKSQYAGCGETLHADFLDEVHERQYL